MRWQPLLAAIRAQKLALARLDPRAGMPVLPPAGASPSAIEAAERRLGRPLPPSYRELLAQHDGLPGFYLGAGLLGVRPLTRGTYVDLARLSIDVEHTAGLVPFGVDSKGETFFAWDTARPRRDGEMEIVVWMNEIGERVACFPTFLELCLEMLSAEIAEHQRPRPRLPEPRLLGFRAA
jgi:SMI1 / KNR4 family (SUKH-1)